MLLHHPIVMYKALFVGGILGITEHFGSHARTQVKLDGLQCSHVRGKSQTKCIAGLHGRSLPRFVGLGRCSIGATGFLPHHFLSFGRVKANHNPAFGPVVFIATLGDKDMAVLIYSISPWTFVHRIPQAVFPSVHLTVPN